MENFRKAATKSAKTQVVSTILEAFRVKNEEFGFNGFVKRDEKHESGRWLEVPDEICREKVGNNLRSLLCSQDPVKSAYRREQRKPLHRRRMPVAASNQWLLSSASMSSSAETSTAEKSTLLTNSHLDSTSDIAFARNPGLSTDSRSSQPQNQLIEIPGVAATTYAMELQDYSKKPAPTELFQDGANEASLFIHAKKTANPIRKTPKPVQKVRGIISEEHPISSEKFQNGTVLESYAELIEWYERLEEMLAFCEEHGTDPRDWPMRPSLARWISQQHRQSLSVHQAQCLDALGIIWDEESIQKLRRQIMLRLQNRMHANSPAMRPKS